MNFSTFLIFCFIFSPNFWLRWTAFVVIAIFQIIAGLAISFLKLPSNFQILGEALIGAINAVIFAFSKLKSGYFSWIEYRAHKSRNLAKLCVHVVNLISCSNHSWLRFISKPLKNVVDFLENQSKSRSEIEKKQAKIIESCRTVVIKSEPCSSAYIAINEYISNLTKRIVDDVAENILDEFTRHDLKDTIKNMLNYLQESDLKALIEEEYPEIQKIFREIKKIQNQVSNIIEDIITNFKESSNQFLIASINLVANAASVKDSVRRIFNHIDETLKDFSAEKTEKDKIPEQNRDNYEEFNNYIIEQLKTIAKTQCQKALNTYVIKPAMTHANNTIRDKSTKNIESIIRKSMDSKKDCKTMQEVINLYEGMDTSSQLTNLSDVPEDLVKGIMHIHSRVSDYKHFRKLMLENLPYDEICIESVRQLLEKKLEKNILIRIVKDKNIFEFGDSEWKDKVVIDIKYSKAHFYSVLIEKCPELKDVMNSGEFYKTIADLTNTNNNITRAIKSFNNGFYKDFRFIDIHRCILESGLGYGSYDELKREFSRQKEKEFVIVHVPAETTYDSLTEKV